MKGKDVCRNMGRGVGRGWKEHVKQSMGGREGRSVCVGGVQGQCVVMSNYLFKPFYRQKKAVERNFTLWRKCLSG